MHISLPSDHHKSTGGYHGFVVDTHHHMLPDFFWQETNDPRKPVGGIAPPPWSKEGSIALMDDAGIDFAITSVSTPGVHIGDDAKARRLARRCNELAATLMQDRPQRFGGFACLPLPDVDGALEEMECSALDSAQSLDRIIAVLNSAASPWRRVSTCIQRARPARSGCVRPPKRIAGSSGSRPGTARRSHRFPARHHAGNRSAALQQSVCTHAERQVHLLACRRHDPVPRRPIRNRGRDESHPWSRRARQRG